MIRLRYIFGYAALALVAIRDGPVQALADVTMAAVNAVRDFLGLAWALLAPEPRTFTSGSWSMAVPMGDALDPALQHSMRHEAGHRRRAAARNT